MQTMILRQWFWGDLFQFQRSPWLENILLRWDFASGKTLIYINTAHGVCISLTCLNFALNTKTGHGREFGFCLKFTEILPFSRQTCIGAAPTAVRTRTCRWRKSRTVLTAAPPRSTRHSTISRGKYKCFRSVMELRSVFGVDIFILSSKKQPKRRANTQTTHTQVHKFRNHISYVPWIHTTQTKDTVHDLFNVCSNHALSLNYSGQESKNNLQCIILTYLLHWNKVYVIKPGMNC